MPAALVKDYMTPEPHVAAPGDTLRDAFDRFRRFHIRHLPVVDPGGMLLGLITLSDVYRALPSSLEGDPALFERMADETTVERIMTRSPEVLAPGDALARAVALFVDRKFGALPVVEGGRLVGILSQIDVLRAVQPLLGQTAG